MNTRLSPSRLSSGFTANPPPLTALGPAVDSRGGAGQGRAEAGHHQRAPSHSSVHSHTCAPAASPHTLGPAHVVHTQCPQRVRPRVPSGQHEDLAWISAPNHPNRIQARPCQLYSHVLLSPAWEPPTPTWQTPLARGKASLPGGFSERPQCSHHDLHGSWECSYPAPGCTVIVHGPCSHWFDNWLPKAFSFLQHPE